MILKQHKSNEQGLSDLLNYAHFIEDGIILNKDGAFLMTFKFKGQDINSATANELDALSLNFNRLATFLDDGWMLHVDELRIPSLSYPSQGHFPDKVSLLIDEERRQLYESEGNHFENLQFLTFVWKFPLPVVKTTKHWFIDGLEKNDNGDTLDNLLNYFLEVINRCAGLLSSQLLLEKLSTKDLLSFLNICISGELVTVETPLQNCFIDVVLGRNALSGGFNPKIGNKYIKTLSIIGYINNETIPGLLEDMATYPLIYRWSNRFIPLSEASAAREIKRYQKQWNNKVKGFSGILREVFTGKPSTKVDQDALQMSIQTNEALTNNSNNSVRFGFWTSEIVLIHEDENLLKDAAKLIERYLIDRGFKCIDENINALDAWLGTIPGHGSCNVRRLFIDSLNLSHVLPLHSIWSGAPHSSKDSLLPPYSPPVFYAATTGKTPFRFNIDVSDVGHQIVLGPTGSGKSTYLGFLIAQFLRFKNAQVYVFDKDYSHKALTIALDGYHYDIGNAEKLSFCPLADLSSPNKIMRAEQFIESLVELQNINITPDIRAAIHKAIISLSEDKDHTSHNITVFCATVQHEAVRSALQYYTLKGQMPLLDAAFDNIKTGYLQTFEMNWLLNQKPEVYIPILFYIFGQIESKLEECNAKNPTLIILEEAWAYINHKLFANKLKDWLKTLRKFNARVVFATQSLSDTYDPSTQTLTSVTATIMESCPTKIYLPNPTMESEVQNLYKKMGLNDRQLEIIKKIAIPKKHYYIVTPEGNRLIELGFNDKYTMALAFIGLSKEKSKILIEYKEKYQTDWVYHYLLENGFENWANYILDNFMKD